MPKSAKIVLAILIATLLGGGGYFYLKLAKKPTEPLINIPPKTEEIDTSDWQTYRNETLGFEIKYPKTIARGIERIGPQPNIEDEFWRKQIGEVNFSQAAYVGTGGPQFRVRVKDSDLSLDRFINVVGITREHQNIFIAGLPAKQDILDGRKDKYPNYREIIVTKNGQRNYVFYFEASDTNINQDILIWNAIISSFKPIP